MRSVIILSFLFASAAAIAQKNIDAQHYKFQLTINDKNDTIYGKCEMTIKFLQPCSSFTIQLANQNDKGQGMIVDEITALNGNAVQNFTRKPDDLKINLTQAQKENDSAVYLVTYHSIPKNGLIISENIKQRISRANLTGPYVFEVNDYYSNVKDIMNFDKIESNLTQGKDTYAT